MFVAVIGFLFYKRLGSRKPNLQASQLTIRMFPNLTKEDYKSLREKEAFGSCLLNFVAYHHHFGTLGSIRRSLQICYQHELRLQDNSTLKTDTNFMKVFGASDLTMIFFDVIDNGVVQKLSERQWLPERLRALKCGMKCHALAACLKTTFRIAVYYADVLKDVFIVVHIQRRMFNTGLETSSDAFNFALCVFYTFVSSILLAEVLNGWYLWTKRQVLEAFGLPFKVLAMLLVPFAPALILIQMAAVSVRKCRIIHNIKEAPNESDSKAYEAKLTWLRTKDSELKLFHARLRSNENASEHFVQLVLAALILLVDLSPTPSVFSIRQVILDNDLAVVIVSAGISLFSLVRGQVQLVAASKNSHLPLAGTAILLLYYAICTSARLFASVLFFTPVLGLFGVLEYGKMGTIPASVIESEAESSFIMVHDVDLASGNATSLSEAWEPFKLDKVGDLYSDQITNALNYALPILILSIHLIISGFISSGDRFWNAIHSLISPPLFNDWHETFLAANSDLIHSISKANLTFLILVILFIIEHILFCIPLAILRFKTRQRAAALRAAQFPPLPHELASEASIDTLLFGSLLFYIVRM